MNNQLLLGTFGALVISLIALRLKALTSSGAVAAFCVGVIVFSLGGWPASIALLTFFVSGSALSRLPRAVIKEKIPRDWKQVIANGGIGAFAILVGWIANHITIGIAFFFGSIATAAADTWATEIGTRFGGRPIDIRSFNRLPPGESGGVSFVGFAAALAGALLIGTTFSRQFEWILICGGSGLAGCVVDSLLGSIFQGKYQCPHCMLATEQSSHCGQPATLIRGFRWMTNNKVNVISVGIGGLILLLAFLLVGRP